MENTMEKAPYEKIRHHDHIPMRPGDSGLWSEM